MQATALTYRALVKLDSQNLEGMSSGQGAMQGLTLSAGMASIAEIHQGKRTVMEYLLSTVRKMQFEAARER
jgi:hemolysin D